MKIRAIVNVGGGSVAGREDELPERVAAAFEAAGVEAELRFVEAQALDREFRAAAEGRGIDAVVAGGGDGTVSVAAQALAGTMRPLGILPLGTLNHLARDAGIPSELDAAAAVIAAGRARPIDVGEVNGRVFVNNSAVGLYPRIVRDKEDQRRRFGRSRRLALLLASLAAARRFSRHRLGIDIAGLRAGIETPLLFVGNNVYETSLLTLGRREALDRGELCLYAPLVHGRLHFVGLGLRGIFGLTRQRDFVSLTGLSELMVRSRRGTLLVALDGEVEPIATPLRYRIRPAALRLIVPPEPAER